MKVFSLPQIRSLSGSQFWFLAIAAGLMAIHLTLTRRIADVSFFSLSLLFWLAASSLFWHKRTNLDAEGSFLSGILGLLLIAIVLLKSATHPTTNFLGIYPVLSGLGLALLASGMKGVKQYWQELTILFFLGVPKVLLWPVVDISAFTAKFSTFILWYAGFDVYRQGFSVVLPGGAVNVNMGCSGFEGMFYLLGLAVMALIMYPLSGKKWIVVPIVALTLAFVVNGVRVALMALFAHAQNQEALDYWHVGDGSLIFSLVTVILFGCFYFFLLKQESPDEPDSVES